MKLYLTSFVCLLLFPFIQINALTYSADSIPLPNASQIAWSEDEMGVLISYDLHVFDKKRYNQNENRITPITDYNIFNPTHLDTDQWIRTIKAAGAKFAVYTVTHETGFATYQSDCNPYSLKIVKWRNGEGDIFRDFVNSCRKYNVKPGVYIGVRWNSLLGIHNFKVEDEGEFGKNRQEWYKKMCEQMTKELCTRYGDLYLIWFDGGADDPRGLGPDVEPIVNKYQPHCLFYHNTDRADFRWGGSETGKVTYPCWSTFTYKASHNKNSTNFQKLKTGDKDGAYWMAAMADFPLRCMHHRHEWFWEPGDENTVASLNLLKDIYQKSIGRNATMLIGVTPDEKGLIPTGDSIRLKEFGEAIKKQYGFPIAQTNGVGKKINLSLKKATIIDHLIIQEDIKKGQRVRHYIIEAYYANKWNKICEGSSIGNKRIEFFQPIKTKKIRLIIKESVLEPQIKQFTVFSHQD